LSDFPILPGKSSGGKIFLRFRFYYLIKLLLPAKITGEVLRRKNSFFYNALLFALLAVTPYIICIGFQLSKKEDAIQKVELVKGKIVPLTSNK
jgi:hypothetical protein